MYFNVVKERQRLLKLSKAEVLCVSYSVFSRRQQISALIVNVQRNSAITGVIDIGLKFIGYKIASPLKTNVTIASFKHDEKFDA